MKKILIIIFLFSTTFVYSYTTEDGIFTFDIPNELEIQSGKVAEFSQQFQKKYHEKMGSKDNSQHRVVLQQKGFNDFKDTSNSRYCRIIINAIPNPPDMSNEELRLGFSYLTFDEKKTLNEAYKKQYSAMYTIKQWDMFDTKDISNLFALHFHYVRGSTAGGSDVNVDCYQILDTNYEYEIVIAYRVNEKKYFEECSKKWLASLKINRK